VEDVCPYQSRHTILILMISVIATTGELRNN
jgi:hypothetical protein